jgi:hypothetical protein
MANELKHFEEIGNPGNTGLWGEAITDEYISKLTGSQGRTMFDRMRRSDPQVALVLRAITLPIRACTFFVQPADDTPESKAIAKTCERYIIDEMKWDSVVRHACLMFPFGFSILEKVWHFRDGLVVPKKLAPRLPQSLYRWVVKDNQLVTIQQVASDGKIIDLPVEKCILFTSDREGDNWEGTSVLRAAYKPWYIKCQLETIDAIKHDRHGSGIPAFKAPLEAKKGDEAWTEARSILKNVRANEISGIIEPPGWDFRIVSPGQSGAGTDAIASIRYHDEQIAKSILAMFTSLGSTTGGNRALGEVFLSMFLDSCQSYADYIAEEMQNVVDEMVAWNWHVAATPKMTAGKVSKIDGEAITRLAAAKLITPDIDIENYVRKASNLPEKKAEGYINPLTVPAAGAGLGAPAAAGVPGVAAADGHTHGHGLALAGRAEKEMAFVQKYCDPVRMGLALADGEQALTKKLDTLRQMQTADIIRQLLAGKKIQAVVVPGKKEMFQVVTDEFQRQRELGAQQVVQEMRRQGLPPQPIPKEVQAAAAGKRKRIPSARVVEYETEMVSLVIDGAASKLQTMISEIYLQAKRDGFSGQALKEQVEKECSSISLKTWEDIADSAVNRGWGVGREEQATKYVDKIAKAHYSTVLDDESGEPCDECLETYESQKYDENFGALVHDVEDDRYICPNSACLGGTSKCRCFRVYIAEGNESTMPTGKNWRTV